VPKRFAAALVVSLLGTAVFAALFQLLESVSGPGSFFRTRWPTIFCAGGSFLSTLAFARVRVVGFVANLRAAAWITFVTYALIAFGHTVERKQMDQEWVGVFGHAVFFTSWWVVPGTAVVLSLLARLLGCEPSQITGAGPNSAVPADAARAPRG